MNKIYTATNNIDFKPYQIVCLEFSATCLYGEVIQIIEQRQTCWVRPMLIAHEGNIFQDFKSSPDVILPTCLFRPCFDNEILPLLSQISDSNTPQNDQSSSFDLNLFIHKIWLAYQDKF